MPWRSPAQPGMDSDSDARPTEQVSSEHTLAAYLQGATDASVTRAPQSAFASSSVTWTSNSRLDSQSRNNLRQTSVVLDTAYERITSLRNSINSMLNRMPPEVVGTETSTRSTDTSDSQSLVHDASIRPPHSALVLSGEHLVEELNLRAARLRTLISPSARHRLEEFESNNRSNARREFVWDRFSHSDRPPRPDRSDFHPALPRPRTPPMPDLVLPRARDLVDPRAAQRRDLQSANRDDSSTMIGRRVAARVNTSDARGSLSSRLSISQIEQRLQAQTAQVARELESMTERLAAQRSRRIELASVGVRGGNPATAGPDNGASVPSQVASTITARGDLRLVPNFPAGGRPPRPTRDVTPIDNTARIVLPQPISRTSSDGTPIDELSAPARRSLSAAFREHIATYRDHVQVTNSSQDIPRNIANTLEVRGTLINLLTRDRDDRFLPARQAEHTQPGVDTNWRDDTSVRLNSSSPVGQSRRRRGWTRLNADGDEIDSDSDDNVSSYTRRLRMRFAYGTPSIGQQATRSHTVTIEDILWRTSGSDSEADALSPDATESCHLLFQGSPPRPPVRHPHPLPTPVEDMLVYPVTKPPQRSRVIRVSKYASLAGR